METPTMNRCTLIDNLRHECLVFKSVAALKRYAKKNNLQVKEQKVLHSIRSFYTDGV